MREQDKNFIEQMKQKYKLTVSQVRILSEQASDLRLWQESALSDFWPPEEKMKGLHDKKASMFALTYILNHIKEKRSSPTDYSSFVAPKLKSTKEKAIIDTNEDTVLVGRCPCPPEAEVLRCCNLKTLDAVQQCSFGCSYCSIQSFYCQNEVKFIGNLQQRLENLQIKPEAWHFGTGQSSDSLLYGDDYGTLSALKAFAIKHPNVVVELKTKSSRTDWIDTMALPRNIIATWSLNAKTIILNEELLTADLSHRLQAARKAADKGILVGFHFHPMVYFNGWEAEYQSAVNLVTSMFKPEEVITISMGTLTFPKPVIQRLRSSERQSRILQMELIPIAGKYSYPLETKRKMFSHLYGCFPEEWKKKVFFYICMEDPSLWKPCLGYEYQSNSEFEAAMKKSYLEKIGF